MATLRGYRRKLEAEEAYRGSRGSHSPSPSPMTGTTARPLAGTRRLARAAVGLHARTGSGSGQLTPSSGPGTPASVAAAPPAGPASYYHPDGFPHVDEDAMATDAGAEAAGPWIHLPAAAAIPSSEADIAVGSATTSTPPRKRARRWTLQQDEDMAMTDHPGAAPAWMDLEVAVPPPVASTPMSVLAPAAMAGCAGCAPWRASSSCTHATLRMLCATCGAEVWVAPDELERLSGPHLPFYSRCAQEHYLLTAARVLEASTTSTQAQWPGGDADISVPTPVPTLPGLEWLRSVEDVDGHEPLDGLYLEVARQ
ncbi:uncharacterized protein BXZ73DRAFT_98527 [Epithele typhae]|uniref:uncharacterized protein n=1 Tax=Epithele typhae TaxID=378194 RepID=UPI0020076E73|nr:uncharacterized protein BXZ73DRAFT_98527 [Epithele typhae]KAH9941312.1 hypothetical protein BXZ73DRAFT_98527 [Epithele typhae]